MGAIFGFLLQGIPLFGKIVDAFSKYQSNKMDAEVEKLKVNGQVDLGVVQARTQLAIAMKDDPATKIGRWFFIVPTGLFYVMTLCDSVKWVKQYVYFGTLEIPQWMQYMPYAVVAYLFVTAWRGSQTR